MLGLIGLEAGMLYRCFVPSYRETNAAHLKASARNSEVQFALLETRIDLSFVEYIYRFHDPSLND